MNRRFFAIFTLFGLLLLSFPASAQRADFSYKGNSAKQVFSLPANAVEVAPGVFSLGSARDPQSGKVVEGLAFVHYKQDPAKPDHAVKPAKPSKSSPCYAFLSKGAKWKTLEPWMVNPDNPSGLSPDFVFSNLTADIAKWEDAADGMVGNNVGVDILGEGTITSDPLVADEVSTDGLNEVYFAPINDSNTIAVTIVWGNFGGPIGLRQLVEWDQVYNTNYLWSQDATGSTTHMDFENIATHELGHAVGLDDLYTLSCAQQTMYGYASEGETNKRSLESGDIAGVNTLY